MKEQLPLSSLRSMKDTVRRSHRLQAKNALQSLWAGPNSLLVWFAQAALVSLVSVSTRDLSFFFLCIFSAVRISETNTFGSVYLRVDCFLLSIPGV